MQKEGQLREFWFAAFDEQGVRISPPVDVGIVEREGDNLIIHLEEKETFNDDDYRKIRSDIFALNGGRLSFSLFYNGDKQFTDIYEGISCTGFISTKEHTVSALKMKYKMRTRFEDYN